MLRTSEVTGPVCLQILLGRACSEKVDIYRCACSTGFCWPAPERTLSTLAWLYFASAVDRWWDKEQLHHQRYLHKLFAGRSIAEHADIAVAVSPAMWVLLCSFGVVLWELTTGRLPEGRHLRECVPADDCPPQVDALMNACLSENPSVRPSAVDIVHTLQDLK